MSHHPLAIVLGVDSPIGLAVIRDLGSHGVPVHGIGKASSIGRASRYCTGFSERPQRPIGQWLPEMIEATGAAAVLAISESDLAALADLPQRIGGCAILTPRAAALRLVLDKRETLRRAAALGIDTPQSWQPAEGDDFAARAGGLDYPIVAKWADPTAILPRLAAHGLEFEKAEFVLDKGGLLALLDRYRPLGCWPLIQSYCPGIGLGQMIHMADSEPTLRFQHRRLHEWPPEGGVSTYCAAEPLDRHRDQMEKSIALLRAAGWQGTAMVEYRFDARTGRYWLMEINGRFWGSLPLAWHCGAHFAWEAYRRAVLGDHGPAASPGGALRARYMIPETRRLLRVLFGRSAIADPVFAPRPLADLLSYGLGFIDPRTRYYVMSLRDPAPFLRDLLNVLAKAVRRRSA
jgi:predicted ATP-grasp superfamily ATP-dependent carboligase